MTCKAVVNRHSPQYSRRCVIAYTNAISCRLMTNKWVLLWAQFKLDEAVLSVGAAYHTALAMEFLSSAEGAKDEL